MIGRGARFRQDSFKPGRKDARVNEAQAFLDGAAHLRNINGHGLACQFNLTLKTAEKLVEIERQKRARVA